MQSKYFEQRKQNSTRFCKCNHFSFGVHHRLYLCLQRIVRSCEAVECSYNSLFTALMCAYVRTVYRSGIAWIRRWIILTHTYTRTHHALCCAVELTEYEVRTLLSSLFYSKIIYDENNKFVDVCAQWCEPEHSHRFVSLARCHPNTLESLCVCVCVLFIRLLLVCHYPVSSFRFISFVLFDGDINLFNL